MQGFRGRKSKLQKEPSMTRRIAVLVMAMGMSLGIATRMATVAYASPQDDKMAGDKMKENKMKDDKMKDDKIDGDKMSAKKKAKKEKMHKKDKMAKDKMKNDKMGGKM
jgi:pentapeptide MXKDX repeat protein